MKGVDLIGLAVVVVILAVYGSGFGPTLCCSEFVPCEDTDYLLLDDEI